MNYVAHMIGEYLGHTLNWVYSQIKYVRKYTPYVITRKTINLDSYPLERIYTSRKADIAPTTRMSWPERIIRRMGFLPPVDFRCFSNVLRRYPPLFLHAHFGWEGFFALGLKRKHNIPLVTRFYGYDVGILPQIPLWRRRYRRLFSQGDYFIVEGNNMKNTLMGMGCPESKIYVHHLGVELEKTPYQSRVPHSQIMRVLIAASFKEKKGIEYALRAIAGVQAIRNDIELQTMIIGDGPLRDLLHGLAKDLEIDKSIQWMGYRSHDFFVQQLYDFDLFLSPSVTALNGDTEGGAPVALIEAGASGLPVISTTHADIPEVVLNGKTGILVPERSVDALVDAVLYLGRNPETRIDMGKQARLHIETNYHAEIQGKQLEAMYSSFDQTING
ncbi:MAG: glycosyltransferase [Bacteroidia bacterium]|nr:glycosyltransferase [Bacteroidia bacterium]